MIGIGQERLSRSLIPSVEEICRQLIIFSGCGILKIFNRSMLNLDTSLPCRRGKKYPMPFDFVIEDLKLIVENDGRFHYKSNPHFGDHEMRQKDDEFKMIKAMEKGYSVIRILQEDVFSDKHDWAEKLVKYLKAFNMPTCLTIRTKSPL